MGKTILSIGIEPIYKKNGSPLLVSVKTPAFGQKPGQSSWCNFTGEDGVVFYIHYANFLDGVVVNWHIHNVKKSELRFGKIQTFSVQPMSKEVGGDSYLFFDLQPAFNSTAEYERKIYLKPSMVPDDISLKAKRFQVGTAQIIFVPQ